MAKKIKFESFVYRFLSEAESVLRSLPSSKRAAWEEFVEKLQFQYDHGKAAVSWSWPNAGTMEFQLSDVAFYHRGDSEKYVAEQRLQNLVNASDLIQHKNANYFREALGDVSARAGMGDFLSTRVDLPANDTRLGLEEKFHDLWASSEDPDAFDVVKANETCTSPEMRYICTRLGNLSGKRLLDVGCGLGEASVYFALKGAHVTSLDLSQGMLDATARLARRYGVMVRIHKAAAESTGLPANQLFDVIYAGNLLHHVDIQATLKMLKLHLAPGGVFVSWDPLAYNPAINIYRAIATDVRTPDEHPLRWRDIRLFRREFAHVTTRYFWLATLIIFALMVLVQRRNPNKERLWKVVVDEGDRWKWLYAPLSKLDAVLLALIPPLRLLCWNVVVIARNPQ